MRRLLFSVAVLMGLLTGAAPALAQQVKTPGSACSTPDYEMWEQPSLCNGTTWQRPAFQFGAATATDQTCSTSLAGMLQWTGTGVSPNDTMEYCDGANWDSLLTSTSTIGSGVVLGTLATANNPYAAGDVTTGLFSDTASTVSVATAGVERVHVDASGNVGIGTSSPAGKLSITSPFNSGENWTEWRGTDGTLYSYVDNRGSFYIGGAGGISLGGALTNQASFYCTSGVGRTSFCANGGEPAIAAYGHTELDGSAYGILDVFTSKGTKVLTVRDEGNVGIATTTPLSALDVNGGEAIGTYAGTKAAPTDGLIVSGAVGIGTTAPAAGTALDIEGAGTSYSSILIPHDTTANRPTTAVPGMMRYNTTTNEFEGFDGTTWSSFGSSGNILGASATNTNPYASGDITTGLFSATASTVSVASGGTDMLDVTSTGVNVNGAYDISGLNAVSFPADDNTSVAVGPSAMATEPSGNAYNTAVGGGALYQNTGSVGNLAASYNVAMGMGALYQNAGSGTEAASYNVAMGAGALYQNTGNGTYAATGNVAMGSAALYQNTGSGAYAANGNVAMGTNALAQNIGNGQGAATYNVALGAQALYQNTGTGTEAATGNVAMGATALYQNTGSGDYAAYGNVAIGDSALGQNTGIGNYTASNNVAIGYSALYQNTGGGNTVLGAYALNNCGISNAGACATNAGSYNTVLGYGVASTTLTTGSGNILIGTSSAVDTPASSTSNFLNIGNLIYGDMASGAVGIGSPTINAGASLDLSSRTDSLLLPTGTTGQRPATPVAGMMRYNADESGVEIYNGTDWLLLYTYTGPSTPMPCTTGAPGTVCPDGTIYAGLTPDGNAHMYVTPCDYGATGSQGSCSTGTQVAWSAGASIVTGATSTSSGRANSAIVWADNGNADSPYYAVNYCHNLTFGGHTDWYLPSSGEIVNTIYPNYVAIGGFTSAYYNTSTEQSGSGANVLIANPTSGGISGSGNSKTTARYIRCARNDNSSAGSGNTPAPFSFTDQTGVDTAMTISSNAVQLLGFVGPLTATCGTGCTAIADNGVWGGTSVSGFNPGDTIAIKLVSSSSDNTPATATVTVGNTTSSTWTVTTGNDPCPGVSTPGTVCPDGTVYAGISPDSGTKMFVTPCDANAYYSGGACVACSSGVWTGSGTSCATTIGSITYGAGPGMYWNNGTSNWTTTGYTNANTGQANTAGLVALSDAGSPYVAANYCATVLGGADAFGHNDWYLPAEYELAVIYANNAAIGNFNTSGSYYWASTEGHINSAYYQRFSDGYPYNDAKNLSSLVRCARR